MESANEAIERRAVEHALALNGYRNGLARRVVALLDEVDRDITDRLAGRLRELEERGRFLGATTKARMEALLAEVRAINAAAYRRVEEQLSGELVALADAEAGYQKRTLDAAFGADLRLAIPAPTRLRAIVESEPIIGSMLSRWIGDNAESRIRDMERAIRVGMVEGKGTDAIVRSITASRGVLDKGRESARMTVRTAVNHVSNSAAQETWRANSDVIAGWRYLATLDSRTSDGCAILDGKVYPIGEGPVPPRHPNCRSTTVPVTKSFRQLGANRDEIPEGKRASIDGQVAASTKFADFMEKKGEAFQNKVLGKTKAKLWREGKLSLDQMLRADGSVATLDDLRQRHASIFQ